MPRSSRGLEPLPGLGLASDEVELGFVSGVFGVRGEVRLHLHNRDSFLLDGRTEVRLIGPEGERRRAVLSVRPGAGKRILGRIDGLQGREDAAALMKWRIAVPEAALPNLDEDEYYVRDLIGLQVVAGDEVVGRVREVHPTGHADVLEIRGSGEPWFVPLVREAVLEVDLEEGRVVVDPSALEEP